ncbi:MAG: hypothetical protein ABI405_09135 [Parafilimonas sp.]
MKWKVLTIIILVFFLGGCNKRSDKYLLVYFENNSDVDTSLIIDTYLNGNIYKSVNVRRDFLKVYDDSLQIPVEKKRSEGLRLMFIIKSLHDTTVCTVANEKIDSVYYIHVNIVKTVFQKGFIVFDKTLDKDSLAYSSFYCELIPKRNSP